MKRRVVVQQDAERVTRAQGAVPFVDEGQVMRYVSRCRQRSQPGQRTAFPRPPGPDAVGGDRPDLTPERIEGLAEEPPGAGYQPGRVGHVRSAVFVDVDRQGPEALREVTGRARVVQVDVGQTEVPEIAEGHAELGESGLQRGQRGRRTGVHQGRLGTAQEGRPNGPRNSLVPKVDDPELVAQPRSSTGTKERSPTPT